MTDTIFELAAVTDSWRKDYAKPKTPASGEQAGRHAEVSQQSNLASAEMPYEVFLAFRYLRSRHKRRLSSGHCIRCDTWHCNGSGGADCRTCAFQWISR